MPWHSFDTTQTIFFLLFEENDVGKIKVSEICSWLESDSYQIVTELFRHGSRLLRQNGFFVHTHDVSWKCKNEISSKFQEKLWFKKCFYRQKLALYWLDLQRAYIAMWLKYAKNVTFSFNSKGQNKPYS